MRERGTWLPQANSDMFLLPSLVDKDQKFWSSLMSEQDGCPRHRLISFTSLKLIECRAETKPSAALAQLCTEGQPSVLLAAPKVGIPWTKKDAVREARGATVRDPR